MTYYLPGIFAILVLAAGWHYLFSSTAASKLSAVENPKLNARRVVMRRINGLVMFLLAVDFYVLCYASTSAVVSLILVGALPFLMIALLSLALVDLRLTRRLQNDLKNRDQ